jgi:hypothetical protein
MVLAAAQSVTKTNNSKLGELTIDGGGSAVTGTKTVQIEVKE